MILFLPPFASEKKIALKVLLITAMNFKKSECDV